MLFTNPSILDLLTSRLYNFLTTKAKRTQVVTTQGHSSRLKREEELKVANREH